jgi:PTH1 family peptidyl-tRNA hydrolase
VRIGVGHPGDKDRVAQWVLSDFAKADREWLDALLEAIAKAAPRLAKDDPSRFLTDVAKALGEDSDPRKAKAADTAPAAPAKAAPRSHPAGERASKSAGAIAENLKKWLAARKPGS